MIFLQLFATLMAIRVSWDIIEDLGPGAWREPLAYVIAAIPLVMCLIAIWGHK